MMGMIYGFDHDSNESVAEFVNFVNASNAPIVMAGLLNALPCTPLMSRLQKSGRLIQASSGNNSDGVINFIPYNFSIQQAEQNYLSILQGIYTSKAYFVRVMRHLKQIDPQLYSKPSEDSTLNYLIKILSRKNARIFWRYLPQAVAIAYQRCGLNTHAFKALLSEFFSLCAQYTHFKAQINVQRKQIAEREYAPWQQCSWREQQEE